jgi:hypothetical protein
MFDSVSTTHCSGAAQTDNGSRHGFLRGGSTPDPTTGQLSPKPDIMAFCSSSTLALRFKGARPFWETRMTPPKVGFDLEGGLTSSGIIDSGPSPDGSHVAGCDCFGGEATGFGGALTGCVSPTPIESEFQSIILSSINVSINQ